MSRKPALYSANAGFQHARVTNDVPPTPITFERHPKVKAGMDYLNDLAGWELFVFSDGDPEVTIHAHDAKGNQLAAWIIEPEGDNWGNPYIRMGIALMTNKKSDAAHELGHCLGLRHRRWGMMSNGKVRPKSDRRLLTEAGYRGGS